MTRQSLLKNNPYHIVELLALLAGLLLPFSFAPYELFWLQFPLLALLFVICIEQNPGRAFLRSFLFGVGWFAHGVYWIYNSLHYHGGAPLLMALFMVVLMGMVLALFPALAFYLSNRFFRLGRGQMLMLVYPLMLIVFEWLRGYVLTGFPWVQIGYAHIDSWLSGYGPLIGGLGIGYLVCLVTGLLVHALWQREYKVAVPAVLVIYVVGFLLAQVNWTQPAGDAIRVSLLQGNIPQSEKWKPKNFLPTLRMYREMALANLDSDLVVWPETALPAFRSRVQNYLDEIAVRAEASNTDMLVGLFVRDESSRRYYNSVISLDGQIYKKRHLVPLGEYFPFRSILGYFSQWIDIPMSDIDNGDRQQTLIRVAGYPVGVNICFEDAFDRDVLLDVPEARLLINVSNDAWFGDTPQPWQHHQLARMRALETGRPLLRATNTGVSSVIGPKGEVMAISQQFQRQVVRAEVKPYKGQTPYSRWANFFLVSVAVIVLLYAAKISAAGRKS